MYFEQNFEPKFVCLHGECVALVRCEAGGNEQHCIGTYNAGLQKLILVDDEVLTQDRDVDQRACCTDVTQSSAEELFIRDGRVKFGSACSLTVTNDCLQGIYDDMDFFRDKLVLRPSEISNSPEVVRRLGVISINTAIEADLYGNVNSTHIGGTKMMNGIGGSGDFTRNAYISIFTCPSVAKEGKISAIVPMVSHHDHTEHDVNIIITEQGVADLRGKSISCITLRIRSKNWR